MVFVEMQKNSNIYHEIELFFKTAEKSRKIPGINFDKLISNIYFDGTDSKLNEKIESPGLIVILSLKELPSIIPKKLNDKTYKKIFF